jgi:transcriptional regulator with XRE-family HTH domain
MSKTGSFATRLRNVREMSSLSQSELAKKAGVNATQIAHFEGGKREPNLENLIKIIKALGISADVLLGTARP